MPYNALYPKYPYIIAPSTGNTHAVSDAIINSKDLNTTESISHTYFSMEIPSQGYFKFKEGYVDNPTLTNA